MSRNVCHASANSESICWTTLNAALSGAEDGALDRVIRTSIVNLYDSPAEFDAKQPAVRVMPVEFKGLRDVFFTYFIQRVPIMLCGTIVPWLRPKAVTKPEIADICQCCIQSYAQRFQATSTDFSSHWREDCRRAVGWTRWWVSAAARDAHYYDLRIVEHCLQDSLDAMLALRYPDILRARSERMQGEYEKHLERWACFQAWLRANGHVFIDKLAEHLQVALPLFSATIGSRGPDRL
jgi:hypothetical protein